MRARRLLRQPGYVWQRNSDGPCRSSNHRGHAAAEVLERPETGTGATRTPSVCCNRRFRGVRLPSASVRATGKKLGPSWDRGVACDWPLEIRLRWKDLEGIGARQQLVCRAPRTPAPKEEDTG